MDDPIDALVSVVIPTRNRCAPLARCLASVLGQSHGRLEVLIIDDGSDDATSRFLSTITDHRVRTFRNERSMGVSAARNRGLEVATGAWVAFVDDDDIWAPQKIAVQIENCRRGGMGWSCTSAVLVDASLRVIGLHRSPRSFDIANTLLACNCVPGGASTVLARRALLLEAGAFDERLAVLADWDMWLRLALASPLAVVDTALAAYTFHSGGLSADMRTANQERRVVLDRYAAERSRRGVAVNEVAWTAYAADRDQRAGVRLRAATGHARGALSNRRVRTLSNALGALVWPKSVQIRDRWHRYTMPRAERRAAEQWLARYRGSGVG